MASSPNVRRSPNSATGADAESAGADADADAAAASVAADAATTTEVENQVVWKRPNMQGSKCSINGYVRLGIVKTVIAELRSVGDDTFREFRESCLGHFIREEWGGFISNAALHALFSNEVVRPDAEVDEFWFRIGHRLIRFSRYEYALVTGLRFGDADFDVHGDDVPPEGSVYEREQSGDALKVAKVLCVCYLIFGVDGGKRIADRWLWTLVEDQTRWESFPWGLYSYQILVTYWSDVSTEVPVGLDPGYHFNGNIYAIMIWACEAIPSLGSKCGIMLGASFIQRPRCTRWKLKKLGHIDFTTFFDDEVLSPTPEEEQESYMQSISDASSERVQYTHRMAMCKRGGRGKGKGKGRARDGDASVGDLAGESIVRQRTSGPVISAPLYLTTGHESSSEPHDPVHTDHQCQSSPIRGPRQTASSSARDTQETAPIIDFDTLFTHMHTCIQSAVQEMRQYVDAVVEKSVKDSDTSTLIDVEHLEAYMGILQFDPGFIGVRWLDDWAAQTVLVHKSFLATCINVWNNSKREGDPLRIDDEDLDFLVSHIHGLRPFWGDHRPWWELCEVLTIWNTSLESSCGHWLVLRIRLEEGIIIMHDSLAQEEDAYLKLRSQQSLGISFLIPTILQRSGFYERRLDITPVPQF
ncbi:hypothetical protein OROMI_011029 [Orobanche minor]